MSASRLKILHQHLSVRMLEKLDEGSLNRYLTFLHATSHVFTAMIP